MSNPEPIPAPTCLDGRSKSFLKALDASEALACAFMTDSSDPAKYGPVIAFESIQSYLEAAKRQQRRIERIRTSLHETTRNPMRKGRIRHLAKLFAEVHFYLICWVRIGKLARFIQRETRFRKLGGVLRPYKPELEDRIRARNHLEHLEEKLPGGKEHGKLEVRADLVNMRNEFMTYGGREVDVGPNSIRLLKEMVGRLEQAVLYGSLEALQNTDERRLSALLNKAASKVRIARTTRKVMKMLRPRA